MLNKLKPTIAVVDSGIGGVSVLNALIDKYHSGNYIYFADNLYMPYGKRNKEFIKKRVDKIINLLNEKYQVDLIILACNTASSSINKEDYKNVITISFNKNLVYLTTPLTKKNLPKKDIIADRTLARLIEKYIFEPKKLDQTIKNHINKYNLNNLNSLILGCTHYELAIDLFKKYLPNIEIYKNSDNILENLNFKTDTETTDILFLQSKNSKAYQEKFFKLVRR